MADFNAIKLNFFDNLVVDYFLGHPVCFAFLSESGSESAEPGESEEDEDNDAEDEEDKDEDADDSAESKTAWKLSSSRESVDTESADAESELQVTRVTLSVAAAAAGTVALSDEKESSENRTAEEQYREDVRFAMPHQCCQICCTIHNWPEMFREIFLNNFTILST